MRWVTIRVRAAGCRGSMRSNTRTARPPRASKDAVKSPAADPPTTATVSPFVPGGGAELGCKWSVSKAILFNDDSAYATVVPTGPSTQTFGIRFAPAEDKMGRYPVRQAQYIVERLLSL